ncbi:MAG: Xylose operon regulatory protein [Verrucomicrobiota bacterium]|jgi:LacI family transcriptional regulator
MNPPQVAILVETSREYGRGLLRGIMRYQQEHGPWSVFFTPQGLNEPPPPWLARWKGDGILARINSPQMAQTILKTGLPAIDLRGALYRTNLPVIGIDNRRIIQMAMEHFLARGFRRFAFCGTPPGEHRYQDERCDVFMQSVRALGMECAVFEHPRRAVSWEQDQRNLMRWLSRLPKPVALMTCHDDRGQQVLNACLRAHIPVPDQIAVLGVDNDEFLGNLCTPPLSSVDVDASQIGYAAAAMLEALMRGEAPRDPWVLLPPRGIVERRSTSVLAIEDTHMALAARVLRENACSPLTVQEAFRQIPLSRSAAYRRYRKLFPTPPKRQQFLERMARACELLKETMLPVAEVARKLGYQESKYFIAVFRAHTGTTPLQYRKKSAPKPHRSAQAAPTSPRV